MPAPVGTRREDVVLCKWDGVLRVSLALVNAAHLTPLAGSPVHRGSLLSFEVAACRTCKPASRSVRFVTTWKLNPTERRLSDEHARTRSQVMQRMKKHNKAASR